MHIRPLNSWTAAIQPHAASVTVSRSLLRYWTDVVAGSNNKYWAEYQWSYGLFATTASASPVVRAGCTQAQNLSAHADQAASRHLYRAIDSSSEFPPPAAKASEAYLLLWAGGTRVANISMIDRTPSTRIRTQWLTLDSESASDIASTFPTTGLILEFLWNGDSRAAITCSVSAVWHNYTISSERSVDYGAWMVSPNDGKGNPENDYNNVRHNRPVTLDSSWLSLLTPTQGTGNLLDNMLIGTGYANAISDLRDKPQQMFGSHRVFNLSDDVRKWSIRRPFIADPSLLLGYVESARAPRDESIMQPFSIYVEGLASSASSTTDYLALAVAATYILVAGLHVIWVLDPGKRISSGAWDTITELLTLAIVSPAPADDGLTNTGAGIHQWRTYDVILQVRASAETAKDSENKVRLQMADSTSSGRLAASVSGVKVLALQPRAMLKVAPEVEYS
ncbi:hypothetical protein LTR95_003400 [Oleoguttula sp. CCFEE 5521]